jgi:hypothetical protein
MEAIDGKEGAEGATVVCIVGTRVACTEGLKDTWRDVASWTAGQLTARFGDAVRLEYHDLFDADCPPLPQGAQLPLVTIGEQVLTSGGKISMPAIRKRLEELGVRPRSCT